MVSQCEKNKGAILFILQTDKKRDDFSFFEIFIAEFSHFFVSKKHFFVSKKWLNSTVKILKNKQKFFSFWSIFFLFSRGDKINSDDICKESVYHYLRSYNRSVKFFCTKSRLFDLTIWSLIPISFFVRK